MTHVTALANTAPLRGKTRITNLQRAMLQARVSEMQINTHQHQTTVVQPQHHIIAANTRHQSLQSIPAPKIAVNTQHPRNSGICQIIVSLSTLHMPNIYESSTVNVFTTLQIKNMRKFMS
jgi:hypothetical protein